ncbi:MAG: response regulator transcription factor [Bacteroidetes bacterium]|nr:response regulator transcription factor [Bacteroidota bacterium]
MKAVIIEDEIKARRILQTLLEEHCPDVQVADAVGDVPNGVKAIMKHKPDVVFLDIELPGFSGFELADFIEDIQFEIIFTTAYDHYALQAFAMSAVDYLLKPIQITQLKSAVEKAKKRLGLQSAEKLKALKDNLSINGPRRIALPVAEGFLFVDQNEIVYMEADNTYTTIYFHNGSKTLVSRSLGEFVELIDSPDFYKPHRSYYVNLNHIRQYNKAEGGHLLMDNGHTVYIARDKKNEFLELMQQRGMK